MARILRDANLETRTARTRLRSRGKPYYRAVEPGLHLGYRKPKSGAGKWVARYYIGGEAYASEVISTADDFSDADGIAILDYRQALTKIRARMVERVRASVDEEHPSKGPLTVEQALDDYISYLENTRGSGKDARYRDRAFIRPKLGDLEVASLSAERLRRWHLELAKTPVRLRTKKGTPQKYRPPAADEDARRARRASANRTLTILKAALNRAWREGKVNSDTAWRRVEPFKKVDAARQGYLSIAEAKRVINASDHDFRKLVQAALQTGARYGELARLTVADFNRDAGTLAICESKSGRSRHVVLTDEGLRLFKGLAVGRTGAEFMLTRADGSSWGKSVQKRPMAGVCKLAKIKPAIGFHGLRHTWASHAVMNGMPLMVVARNLGHADTRMVEKHYGHLAPSYIAEAIRAGAPRFGVRASNVRAI